MISKKTNGINIVKKMVYLACLGLMISILPSCNKSKDQSQIAVYMTDAPGDYDAVLIDVQGLEVTGNGGPVMFNTTTGIYNLLDFSNGLSTLIATGSINVGTVSQIRLILGPNNSVMVDSILYPLSTPSAEQSGLKLQVHKTFEPGVSYNVLLDFDAGQSIVQTGNGQYKLKPVIRTIDIANSGSIKGSITPPGLIVAVTAASNGVSYSSITNASGQFLISGLPGGLYNITITPSLPLLPVTITGKSVTIGVSTDIGVVVL